MFLFLIITGLILLILGGDWLLKASVNISVKLEIPRIVIGMTIVSFATSAPELIVSIRSALDGFSDISLGNVIGSNIANIALVLGVTVCFSKIDTGISFLKLDWPVMIAASFLLFLFIYFDHQLDRYEGMILFLFLILFLVYLLKTTSSKKGNEDVDHEIPKQVLPISKIIFFLVMGAIGLWGGSELLINGAVGLATELNISERIIAVTVVSIGTSIPELAASIIAIVKKEKAISLGNLIGSNVFNILAVLGITSIIQPIKVNDLKIINHDIYWMLAVALLILPLCLIPKKLQFDTKEGIVLLSLYALFIYYTIS